MNESTAPPNEFASGSSSPPPSESIRDSIGLLANHGGIVEVRIVKTDQGTVSGYFDNLDALTEEVKPWDGFNNIYFTLNPVAPELLARSINLLTARARETTGDKDITRRVRFLIDCDPVRPAGTSSTDDELKAAEQVRDQVVAFLRELGWADPIEAMSGNGAHAVYAVDLPNDDATRDLFSQALAVLAARFSTTQVMVDTSVFNAARICKLYGTMSCKGEDTPERPHRRSVITREPEEWREVTGEQLQEIAALAPPPAPTRTSGDDPLPDIDVLAAFKTRDLYIRAANDGMHYVTCPWIMGHSIDSGPTQTAVFEPGGDRDRWGFKCMHASCVERNILDVIMLYDIRITEPRLSEESDFGAPEALEPGVTLPRAKIRVTGDLVEMSRLAWAAVRVQNDPRPRLFRRGSLPVRIERDETQIPSTKPLTLDRLRHETAQTSIWMALREEKWKRVIPPKDVIADMLATSSMPLPRLDRIVEVPVFTASGTIRTIPGYDPAGRTLYAPPAGFVVPAVSEAPTAEEQAEAKRLILGEVFVDFKFLDDADRAHAVALMLLPFARDLIDGPTPMHNSEAPTVGNGKTLLIDAALMPSLGRNVPTMSEGRDDDEWRKRISSKIFSAAPVLFLDNLTRRLDSGAVASALTTVNYEDRVLGKSEMQVAPVRCVWCCSGNNPTFSLEIARRAVRIRIDAGEEQPWLRDGFRHPNIREWIMENRPRLVWACLTMIQAWIAAGRPAGTQTLGMYEAWAKTMGGVLQVAGIRGFLGNLQDFYAEADTETQVLREFYGAWWEKIGTKRVTVKNLLMAQVPVPDHLQDGEPAKMAVRLGRFVAANRDKSIQLGDGRTVKVVRDQKVGRDKSYTWRMEEKTR